METIGALSFAGLALVAALYGLASEGPVLTYGSQNSASIREKLTDGQLAPALSFYAQKRLMASCTSGMTSILQSIFPMEERQAHARHCRDMALAYVEATPIDGFSWYVAAQASFSLGETDPMNRYLHHSWTAHRNEQWLASLRVSLSESARPFLTEANLQANRADLSVMVMSRSGIDAIAGRYMADEAFRERITDIVETLAPQDQQRFVNSVRRAARN